MAEIDWTQAQRVFENTLKRSRHYRANPIILPGRTPVTESITTIKGQLLLKLLDIERTRCNSKVDEDERTESLAQLLEGQEHILERLHSGMDKYMQLLGIPEEASVAALSIPDTEDAMSDMQPDARRAFFNESDARVLIRMHPYERDLWDRVLRVFGQQGIPMQSLDFLDVSVNHGGHHRSQGPETQVSINFRIDPLRR